MAELASKTHVAGSPRVAPRWPPGVRSAAIRRWANAPAARLAPLGLLFVAITVAGQPRHALAGDEPTLLPIAHRLLAGQYAGPPTHGGMDFLWHGPALPALLAPLVAAGAPIEILRLLGPALLFAAVVAFGRLLRLYVAPRRALLGAYAFGLYVPFYSLLPTVRKEPLALLLVVLALYWCTLALRSGAYAPAVKAGVALGVLALTRLELGWVVLVLLALAVAWSLRRPARPGPRRLVLACAVAFAVCLPWLGYTYAQTGKPLYWGNAGGLSLYWMSSRLPGEVGDWHSAHIVREDPRLAAHRPLFARLARLSPVAQDTTLRRIALRRIASHPGAFAANVVDNAGRLVVDAPYGFGRPLWQAVPYAVFNALLLGALTAVALRRRSRWSEAGIAFGAFALLAVLVHLPLSADPRMLMPVVPVAILAVVAGAGRRSGAMPERRLGALLARDAPAR